MASSRATIRMTGPTVAVLEVLVDRADRPIYGLEIGAATGLASGTVHPILARLEGIGWVSSAWEQTDASAMGRPRRRYYRLTGAGAASARQALAVRQAAQARRRASSGAPRPGTSSLGPVLGQPFGAHPAEGAC